VQVGNLLLYTDPVKIGCVFEFDRAIFWTDGSLNTLLCWFKNCMSWSSALDMQFTPIREISTLYTIPSNLDKATRFELIEKTKPNVVNANTILKTKAMPSLRHCNTGRICLPFHIPRQATRNQKQCLHGGTDIPAGAIVTIAHYHKRKHFPTYTSCSEIHNNTCPENRKIRGLKFDTL